MTKDQQCPECHGLNVHYSYCSLRMTFENLDEMHDASDRLRELQTPQGEPALTQSTGLPGTMELVVIEPKGNTGESQASLSSKERVSISVEGSELMMELFNRMPVESLKAVPEPIQKRIGQFMVDNGYRFVFDRWFLQADPKAPERSADETSRCRCGSPLETVQICRHCGFDGVPAVEPTRCIDCGVSLVPEARHFSGCKSHPGERAVNGSGDV